MSEETIITSVNLYRCTEGLYIFAYGSGLKELFFNLRNKQFYEKVGHSHSVHNSLPTCFIIKNKENLHRALHHIKVRLEDVTTSHQSRSFLSKVFKMAPVNNAGFGTKMRLKVQYEPYK